MIKAFGAEIRTDNGPLSAGGDPGLSAGFKDDFASIVGQERAIPIFNHATGSGGASVYRVIKFVGIRVMAVDLTVKDKYLIVQPTTLIHGTVIPGKDEVKIDSVLAKPTLIE